MPPNRVSIHSIQLPLASTHESNRQLDMRSILNPEPNSPTSSAQSIHGQMPLPTDSAPFQVPPPNPGFSQESVSCPVTPGHQAIEPGPLPSLREAIMGIQPPQDGAVDATATLKPENQPQQQCSVPGAAGPSPSRVSAMRLRNLSNDTLYTSEPLASHSQGTTSPVSPTYGLMLGNPQASYSQPHLPLTHKNSPKQVVVLGADGRIPYTIDINSGSMKAAEKRRKNSYASKRFRQRKKAGEAEQMCMFRQQEDKLRQITEERDFYRAERDAFKELACKAGVAIPPRPVSPRSRSLDIPRSSSRSQSEDTIPATQRSSQGSTMSDVDISKPASHSLKIIEFQHPESSAAPLQPRATIGPSTHIPFRFFQPDGPPVLAPRIGAMPYPPS
ncbi:hypothetical protein AAP_06292 [Ascosphaera apis ARSEF 7405]|uniref:BZIP domain-containing protein n=1 Tax=Ascosphaera apis ARSEF 7405 TaxID=392613 RepID=A0A167UWY9_9EURO|nr:hypothetical protein AAP_06292 [Ascosphaera apis ARSEF 7405]